MSKPIYVLGTGLSHNGSAVLLKDGKVHTAIEKERLSRIKHDGGNDTLAIEYCLNAAGIALSDVEVVVQCANFEYPKRDRFGGPRLFAEHKTLPLIDISHHLAHAYSAAGTCPFDTANILVVDGCGSPYEQVIDVSDAQLATPDILTLLPNGWVCEKDSFYFFDGQKVLPVIKDFSETTHSGRMSMTVHSIGGFYAQVSEYIFGNLDDVGKLMGLAPFGDPTKYSRNVFIFDGKQLKMVSDWDALLDRPSKDYHDFKQNFSYFADIAAWAQQQVTGAIEKLVSLRMLNSKSRNLCYSGGVALNIVANTQLLEKGIVDSLYVEPAAGDNGLALGCAYYGWLETLNKPRVPHTSGTSFGIHYKKAQIQQDIEQLDASEYDVCHYLDESELLAVCAQRLAQGEILGWFQGGSEFGPRALGHRSILAHPGIESLHQRINQDVKNREDFRPFAPAVLLEDVSTYYEIGQPSPYMLAIDFTKDAYKSQLINVTHKDQSARLQTVTKDQNPKFAGLLSCFKDITGISVLLNTSLNRRGQPIVETPAEAIELLQGSALEGVVIENYLILKRN